MQSLSPLKVGGLGALVSFPSVLLAASKEMIIYRAHTKSNIALSPYRLHTTQVELQGAVIDFIVPLTQGIALVLVVIGLSSVAIPRRSKRERIAHLNSNASALRTLK